jgi:sodium transport system permease protein
LVSFVYPLLAPILLTIMLVMLSPAMSETGADTAPRISIHATGLSAAPELAKRLGDAGIMTRSSSLAHDIAVRSGRVPAALDVERRSESEIAITLYYDPAALASSPVVTRISDVLRDFAVDARLALMRHIVIPDPPVVVEVRQVTRPRGVAENLIGMIPPLLMFIIFLAGTHLMIDMIAGERERGSLEPLLASPVSHATFILGKASVALGFTMLSVGVHLAAVKLLIGSTSGGAASGRLGTGMLVTSFIVSIPMMICAIAILSCVTALTRSMKEAQLYVGLLPVVPSLPGMALSVSPPWVIESLAYLPVFGHLATLFALFRGESVAWTAFVVSTVMVLLLALGAIWLTVRLFTRDRQINAD